MHCFEVRTANVDYLVGVEEAWAGAAPPPPDSGLGAYLARSWETAVRHALLPVTHHSGEGHDTICHTLWLLFVLYISSKYSATSRYQRGLLYFC